MLRRTLGTSGIEVSAIGLGCMGMSWGYRPKIDQRQADEVIGRALDLGVTLLDTSDIYGPYTNEELVGHAIAGRRGDVVVATKGGLVLGDRKTFRLDRDGSPAHLRAACDASLGRLGVEQIDLYYLHRVDPAVPVEDSVGALGELVDAGKVRAIGLCEVDVQTLERAARVRPLAAVQSELSLWTRDPLAEVVPWCREHDVAFVAFSPLGRGFLTGRYRSPDDFLERDFRRRNPRFQAEAMERNLALVDRVREIADRYGASPGQVAIAWTLAQGEHVIAIPGTKRVSYLEENVAAEKLRLDDEALHALDELPAAVGRRY